MVTLETIEYLKEGARILGVDVSDITKLYEKGFLKSKLYYEIIEARIRIRLQINDNNSRNN